MSGQLREALYVKLRLLFTLSIGVLSCASFAQTTTSETQPWNIVAIVTDDQARWAVGAYGNKDVRTPNMDRLAREGALFTQAFVNTPVCSPSRASYFTGQRAVMRLGITDFISAGENRTGSVGIPADTITWPQVLQQNGYRSGLVGKWHLGIAREFHPKLHGFDYFYGFLGGGVSPRNPTLEVDGQTTTVEGMSSDLMGEAAVRFLDQKSTAPFALCLHFREPHLPYRPAPDQDAALFANTRPAIPADKSLDVEQVTRWTRDYYTSIHAADRNIGRVLDKLDEQKLTSRTIVLFTSDHGYMVGQHLMHTKGNGWWIAGGVTGPKRPNMFDDSIRIPLIIRWPGQIAAGSVVDAPITNLDLYPTLLSMLGVTAPAGLKLDGRDLSDVIAGKGQVGDDPIFGEYDLHNGGLAYMRMIRTSEWKLVRHYFASGLDELYHLSFDPTEDNNLYGKKAYREIQAELQKKLTNWQKSMDDPILGRLPADALQPEAGAGAEE
jgi:uncharacterized sulfatase